MYKIKNLIKFSLCALLSLLVASCTPKTSYENLNNTALSSYFSVQDQVNLLNALSDKLSSSSIIKDTVGNRKPTLLVDVIKNKTSEQIDTESITDTLKTTILSSGMFRIINREKLNLLAKEQELNSSGLTDSAKAAQIGKLYGAQYVLYGNFSSIVNYAGKSKNTYYKLTMFLQNIETGEEIWASEASVNKVTK